MKSEMGPVVAVVRNKDAPANKAPGAQVRGIGWASNIGFGVAALGLALTIYSLWWAHDNYPSNYNPGGLSGSKTGAFLFFAGLVAGIAFIFLPMERATGFKTRAGRETWALHLDAARYLEFASRIVAYVGIGLTLLGLLLAAYIASIWATANPSQNTLNFLGTTTSFSYWVTTFLILAVAGGFLWAVFWVRANAYFYALQGFAAASQTGGSTSEGSAKAQEGAPYAQSELHALMKRLDGMLSNLPEDQVAAFSKSREAETYLKILSSKEK